MKLPHHARVGEPTLKRLLAHAAPPFAQLPAEASVAEALRLMAARDVRALAVMEGDRVVGILSERDYARHAARERVNDEAPVSRLMIPRDAEADVRLTVADAWTRLTTSRARHLPVIEEGRPVALVSVEDLQRELLDYCQRVFAEIELDAKILFLRGTYSC